MKMTKSLYNVNNMACISPIFILVAGMLNGCGLEEVDDLTSTDPDQPPRSVSEVYQPAPSTSWQWQLQGDVNLSYDVTVYDIDLFDTSFDTIRQLQASGKKVICYFSAGSYEEWRDDADDFPETALGGQLDGWAGERWLDVRDDAVRSIMQRRLDLAAEKGCDGVEPDNMDGYANRSGLDFDELDQLDYNRFLANEAHARDLSIGLKNDLDQVAQLVDYFDFAVNEQCFEYAECDLLMPFIQAGKAVLNVEYHDRYVNGDSARAALCNDANDRQFSTLILPLDLDDAFRFSCK